MEQRLVWERLPGMGTWIWGVSWSIFCEQLRFGKLSGNNIRTHGLVLYTSDHLDCLDCCCCCCCCCWITFCKPGFSWLLLGDFQPEEMAAFSGARWFSELLRIHWEPLTSTSDMEYKYVGRSRNFCCIEHFNNQSSKSDMSCFVYVSSLNIVSWINLTCVASVKIRHSLDSTEQNRVKEIADVWKASYHIKVSALV